MHLEAAPLALRPYRARNSQAHARVRRNRRGYHISPGRK
jgi:hypothetical protein